jgi:hypothetical protein
MTTSATPAMVLAILGKALAARATTHRETLCPPYLDDILDGSPYGDRDKAPVSVTPDWLDRLLTGSQDSTGDNGGDDSLDTPPDPYWEDETEETPGGIIGWLGQRLDNLFGSDWDESTLQFMKDCVPYQVAAILAIVLVTLGLWLAAGKGAALVETLTRTTTPPTTPITPGPPSPTWPDPTTAPTPYPTAPPTQTPPELTPLHGNDTLNKDTLDYWRKQSDDNIVKSLTSGGDEQLTIRPDGTVLQGNHRITVLKERGYDTSNLYRSGRIMPKTPVGPLE